MNETKDQGTPQIQEEDSSEKTNIILNGQPLVLNPKSDEPLLFVEVFNHLDLDVSTDRGDLVMLVNQQTASYVDVLKEGDVVEVFWQDRTPFIDQRNT